MTCHSLPLPNSPVLSLFCLSLSLSLVVIHFLSFSRQYYTSIHSIPLLTYQYITEHNGRGRLVPFPLATYRTDLVSSLTRPTTYPSIQSTTLHSTRHYHYTTWLQHTGWLFLFAVLMAAVLLFTMVFFVRPLCALDYRKRANCRLSCFRISNAVRHALPPSNVYSGSCHCPHGPTKTYPPTESFLTERFATWWITNYCVILLKRLPRRCR